MDLSKARVLIRLDLNVPLDKKDGKTITDDTRLRAVVPTMKFLKEQNASVVVATHIGRPKGEPDPKYSVDPIVTKFSELLGAPVTKVDDCVGDGVKEATSKMSQGDVILLENVRFHKGETKNHADFAEALAMDTGATCYVNDAFGTAHRAHASTEGVVKYIDGPAAGGFLMEKELKYIKSAIDAPVRPLTAILGGAKVSTKIPVIESMLDKCDGGVLVGGAMIFTFYKAMGKSIGSSMVEEDMLDTAKGLLEKAKAMGVPFLLPTDVVIATEFSADAEHKTVSVDDIPDGWMGLDIGPESIKAFSDVIANSKTIVWNGPMGVFEFDAFSKGTFAVANALADVDATTIVGGGDSVAAVEKAHLADKMSHISTGGGASLELLEGKVLPGVAALNDP